MILFSSIIYPSCKLCHYKDFYILDSITTFKYLHEGKTNSESGDRNSTEIIVDDDCDLILPRKDIQNSLKIGINITISSFICFSFLSKDGTV